MSEFLAQSPMISPILPYLVPFFTLSYPTDTPSNTDSFHDAQYYSIGPLDACFVVTWISVMAILRDVIRLAILEPFARWKLLRDLEKKALEQRHVVVMNGNGHHTSSPPSKRSRRESRRIHRSVLRFAEQGWAALYYAVQWTYGIYVHRNLPTQILNPIDLWVNYPHFPLSGPLKFYYLTQTAFYLHQILILNAEARRKDHYQMMAHHVITCLLLGWSYIHKCTRVGCLILILMDYSDIFLPLAKMFRYLAFSWLCDATFVWFLLSWFVTRHVLFVIVIKSIYADLPKLPNFGVPPGCGRYLDYNNWAAFVTMLSTLQVLQVVWFGMICRVAWRVVSGRGATDERSDDESDSEERDRKEE